MKAKNKASGNKTKLHSTGGGPCNQVSISSIEEETLNLLGHVPVHWQPHTVASTVAFNFNKANVDHNYIKEYKHNPLYPIIHIIQCTVTELVPPKLEVVPINITCQPMNETQTETPPASGSNTYKGSKKLTESVKASQELTKQIEKKIQSKENYLKKKLELYQEDIHVKQRIADALENLVNYFVYEND